MTGHDRSEILRDIGRMSREMGISNTRYRREDNPSEEDLISDWTDSMTHLCSQVKTDGEVLYLLQAYGDYLSDREALILAIRYGLIDIGDPSGRYPTYKHIGVVVLNEKGDKPISAEYVRTMVRKAIWKLEKASRIGRLSALPAVRIREVRVRR